LRERVTPIKRLYIMLKFLLGNAISNNPLKVLQDLLQSRFVILLKVDEVFGIRFRQDSDIFDLTPAFEIFVTAEPLDAIWIL
jgi:hypothetical protein